MLCRLFLLLWYVLVLSKEEHVHKVEPDDIVDIDTCKQNKLGTNIIKCSPRFNSAGWESSVSVHSHMSGPLLQMLINPVKGPCSSLNLAENWVLAISNFPFWQWVTHQWIIEYSGEKREVLMKQGEKKLYNGRTHLGNVLNLWVCFVLAGVKQVQPADGQLELELFRFVLPRCVLILTSLFLGTSPQCLMKGPQHELYSKLLLCKSRHFYYLQWLLSSTKPCEKIHIYKCYLHRDHFRFGLFKTSAKLKWTKHLWTVLLLFL